MGESFEEVIRKSLDQKMADFQEQGSSWSLKSILHLTININRYNPMRVGSYIPLPKDVQNRKACINIKNQDYKCFKLAILASLHPASYIAERVTHYKPFEHTLIFDGIKFPVEPKDVTKFERQNDVLVNVYILKRYDERHDVSPLHLTSFKQEQHVNLLLI